MPNKNEERLIAEELFKLLGVDCRLSRDRENPDFSADIGGKKIGIEITSYHSYEDNKKSNRGKYEELGKLIKMLHSKKRDIKDLKGIHGRINFINKVIPRRSDFNDFCDELIGLSLEMLRSDTRVTYNRRISGYSYLKKYLAKFELKDIGCDIDWETNLAILPIAPSMERLIDIVKDKLHPIFPRSEAYFGAEEEMIRKRLGLSPKPRG